MLKERSYVKLNQKEAKYIQILYSVGLRKHEIAKEFNYKYMDVVNVLRGNSYNHVTGILKIDIPANKVVQVMNLLQNDFPYRQVAAMTGVEDNKVRNILGYLKYMRIVQA